MFHRPLAQWLVLGTAIALLSLPGCGGGDTGTQAQGEDPLQPASVLSWDPPVTYDDATPLDPSRDLDYYEFYIREDEAFSEADEPLAQVAAVTDVLTPEGDAYLQELTREFYLDNLIPFAEQGKRYYLSVRAVGVDGVRSGFSAPVVWDLS